MLIQVVHAEFMSILTLDQPRVPLLHAHVCLDNNNHQLCGKVSQKNKNKNKNKKYVRMSINCSLKYQIIHKIV